MKDFTEEEKAFLHGVITREIIRLEMSYENAKATNKEQALYIKRKLEWIDQLLDKIMAF